MAPAPDLRVLPPVPLEALPGLDALWARTRGVQDILIAVLDGPVDTTHPALATAALTTPSARQPPPSASDHGTHVTSIVFGQPGGPLLGIAPGCRGLVLPVYAQGDDGGLVPCSQLELARAIHRALDAGAHVLNISGGQLTRTGEADPFLTQAVRRCAERNVLVVSAVGNDGCACLHVPAALPSVLAVGATDAGGRPLAFSNWGTSVRTQGVMAPGQEVLGALAGGGVGSRTGTSFATPIVTGVVGLLLSLQVQRGQAPDAIAVREALLRTAHPCEPGQQGCERMLMGRLNIPGAMRLLFASKVGLPAVQAPGMATTQARSTGGSAAVRPSELDSRVYAIGRLGYDFGSEARRAAFIQRMGGKAAHPADPLKMAEHLKDNQEDSNALIWTLEMDATPVYAIRPEGPFAVGAFLRLIRLLVEQEVQGVERISLAGHVVGATRLFNGSLVPTLVPVPRGLFSWSLAALTRTCFGAPPTEPAARAEYDASTRGLRDFLVRIYLQLRNPGASSRDRAMNFAATNMLLKDVYEDAVREALVLDTLGVEPSGVCRPGSDCWDVKLRFFDPEHREERARKVYRYAVDVSDCVPVTLGGLRSWYEY